MRIVGGLARGIRLKAPKGRDVRPTSDRVKESVFGVLGDLTGLVVADLFSGTGALGLEALSRGAARVFLVERDPGTVRLIRDNLDAVLRALPEEHAAEARIVTAPVEKVPNVLGEYVGRVDVILADPPYYPDRRSYGAARMLGDERMADWAGDALLVLEHDASTVLPWHPASPWVLQRRNTYGKRAVSFARRKTPDPAGVSARTP